MNELKLSAQLTKFLELALQMGWKLQELLLHAKDEGGEIEKELMALSVSQLLSNLCAIDVNRCKEARSRMQGKIYTPDSFSEDLNADINLHSLR